MPVVNPGIRRQVAGAITRLFNSASFSAPLTHSLVPERGTGSPTFTRASTATVMGYGPTDNAVDGLKLLTVAANEARFVGARRISEGVWSNTFADGSLIPAATNTGYLAEGARTNLCTYSNGFDNAAWSKLNAGTGAAPVVTPNYAVAPDGTTTAYRLQLNRGAGAGSGNYSLLRNANIAGLSNPHTVAITVYGKTTSGGIANIIVGGSTGPVTGVTVTSEWTRLAAVPTSVSSPTNGIDIYLRDNVGVTNDQSADILIWGAQFELGSFASSYIPTTTIAVARNADVLTYSSAGNVDYGSAHSVLCTATYLGIDNAGLVWNAALGSDVNYSGFLRLTTGAANNASIYVSDSGGTQSSSVAGTDAARKGVMLKYAGTRNSSSGITHAANGVVGTTSAAAGAAGAVTVIQVGCHASASHLFGTINNVRIWQRALSSSELQAVTA